MNVKKLLILNLPYLLFVYPFDKLAQAVRLAPGADRHGRAKPSPRAGRCPPRRP